MKWSRVRLDLWKRGMTKLDELRKEVRRREEYWRNVCGIITTRWCWRNDSVYLRKEAMTVQIGLGCCTCGWECKKKNRGIGWCRVESRMTWKNTVNLNKAMRKIAVLGMGRGRGQCMGTQTRTRRVCKGCWILVNLYSYLVVAKSIWT